MSKLEIELACALRTLLAAGAGLRFSSQQQAQIYSLAEDQAAEALSKVSK